MIVRDEERNLGTCLDSLAGLADEIVVVDTGSTDRTREVATRYGAQVHDFAWVDDFAAARNESIRHARGRWILWLDADEWLDAENRARLARLLDGLDGRCRGYRMHQRSAIGAAAQRDESGTVIFQQVRLFPNAPGIRWEYRVHEQIGPSIERQGGEVLDSDVFIEHSGYADPGLFQRKAERNLRLLEREVAERPDDAFPWLNLGWALYQLGRTAEAVPALERAREREPAGGVVNRKACALLVRCHYERGEKHAALERCRDALRLYPADVQLQFLEAVLLSELGDAPGAEVRFRRLLASTPTPAQLAAGFDTGLVGYKARHNLARICRAQERFAEAEAAWRAAVKESPASVGSWLELGEMLLAQGRAAECGEVVRSLRELGAAGAAAADQLRSWGAASDLRREAEVALDAGDLAAAEARFERLAALGLQAGPALWRLGVIANRRGDFARAWERHRQALAADPNLAEKISPPGAPHRTLVAQTYDVEEVMACPVCGGAAHEPMMVVNCLASNHHHASIDPIRRWVRCAACVHGFANPRPGPDAIRRAYREPPPAHLQTLSYERLTRASDIVHELWSRRPGGDLLDVGVSMGAFAGVAMDYGYRVCGIDVHAGYRHHLERLGVEFVHGDAGTHDFGARRFDVIMMGDVLEHLADPRRALAALVATLRPRGLVWISTPNHEGVWTRARRDRDPMWLEGEHLHFFSLRSLTRLLEDVGLVRVDYRLSKTFLGCAEVIAERA
jgi:glycosyltransferase involved in cell wall biosynthesis/SAM-dependent methyltransferase